MLKLDYISCILTIISTVSIGKKLWQGRVIAGANSIIICVIGMRRAQFGVVPANLFCIGLYANNLRNWRPKTNCRLPFLSEPPDSEQDSVEESLRPGWTARNVNDDGHDVLDASQRGVIFAKDATAYAAGTNRDHDFRFWHSLIGLQQSQLHVPGDRSGAQEHVAVTRTSPELNSQPFHVMHPFVARDH